MTDSDDDIIEEHERRIAEGRELEGYTPVHGKVDGNLTVSTSVRFKPQEYEAYYAAAKAQGLTLSEFLRAAAAAAVNGQLRLDQITAVEEARQKAHELVAALDGLQA